MAAKKRATKKKATKKAASKKRPVAKKAAAKKAASKKRASKKKASGKKAAGKKSAAKSASAKSPSKSEMLNHIADETDLSRKEVNAVLESLTGLIGSSLTKRGYGMFRMPGLFKISVKKVPARKEHMAKSPFTGEMELRKAKPASKKVRVVALKALKDVVV